MAKKQQPVAPVVKPDDPRVIKSVQEIFKHRETHRTWRMAIICTLIGFAVWCISSATVKISQTPTTDWSRIVGIAVTAIGIWSYHPLRWSAKLKAYLKKDHERTIELEAVCDPDRETSGIKKDGTAHHEHI